MIFIGVPGPLPVPGRALGVPGRGVPGDVLRKWELGEILKFIIWGEANPLIWA